VLWENCLVVGDCVDKLGDVYVFGEHAAEADGVLLSHVPGYNPFRHTAEVYVNYLRGIDYVELVYDDRSAFPLAQGGTITVEAAGFKVLEARFKCPGGTHVYQHFVPSEHGDRFGWYSHIRIRATGYDDYKLRRISIYTVAGSLGLTARICDAMGMDPEARFRDAVTKGKRTEPRPRAGGREIENDLLRQWLGLTLDEATGLTVLPTSEGEPVQSPAVQDDTLAGPSRVSWLAVSAETSQDGASVTVVEVFDDSPVSQTEVRSKHGYRLEQGLKQGDRIFAVVLDPAAPEKSTLRVASAAELANMGRALASLDEFSILLFRDREFCSMGPVSLRHRPQDPEEEAAKRSGPSPRPAAAVGVLGMTVRTHQGAHSGAEIVAVDKGGLAFATELRTGDGHRSGQIGPGDVIVGLRSGSAGPGFRHVASADELLDIVHSLPRTDWIVLMVVHEDEPGYLGPIPLGAGGGGPRRTTDGATDGSQAAPVIGLMLRNHKDYPSVKGAEVVEVKPDGPTHRAGRRGRLVAGDLIVGVWQPGYLEQINTKQDLEECLDKFLPGDEVWLIILRPGVALQEVGPIRLASCDDVYVRKQVQVVNDTSKEITVYLSWYAPGEDWRSAEWTIAPHKRTFLLYKGSRLKATRIKYWAKSTDDKYTWREDTKDTVLDIPVAQSQSYVLHLHPGSGARRAGRPSQPSRAKIAFVSKRDGNDEIYVMDADGNGQERLTNAPVPDWSPTWSPDGRRIAWVRFVNKGGEPTSTAMYVMNADGTGENRIPTTPRIVTGPAWSPAGRQIAFAGRVHGDDDYDIYVINADGSAQHRVTNNSAEDSEPSWSPDGGRIAFVTNRDRVQEIYVMNADGTHQTRLTHNSARDTDPAWSPDGRHIAFTRDDEHGLHVYVMNVDGSGEKRLTNGFDGQQSAWSPDGRRIAFVTWRHRDSGQHNTEIYVMNADGTGHIRLTNNEQSDNSPAWSASSPSP